MKQSQQGFSLLGVLIVIVTIGLLMIYLSSSTNRQISQKVSVNLFDRTVGKTNEAITKENISILRQAISKYRVENNTYPMTLDSFGDPPFVPTYLRMIPPAKLGMSVAEAKRNSNRLSYGITVTNEGGWLYDPYSGKIIVNFDGMDSDGINYTAY